MKFVWFNLHFKSFSLRSNLQVIKIYNKEAILIFHHAMAKMCENQIP